MNYPVPGNEIDRQRQLDDLSILDTPRDEAMETLVQLACSVFDVPICAISLIDRQRQWFKAGVGLGISETKREDAFCSHTIAGTEPFIVENALTDARFRKNPHVVGGPKIRFYAGVPLALSAGVNLGSFCIIDFRPSGIDEQKLKWLDLFGRMAVSLLRQTNAIRDMSKLSRSLSMQVGINTSQKTVIEQQRKMLDRASALAKLGTWEVDLRSGMTSWSEGMYALHGVDRSFHLGADNFLQFYPEPDRSRLAELMEKSRKECCPYRFEGRMFTANGELRWVRIVGDVEVVDSVPRRRFGLWQDISDEKSLIDRIKDMARRDELTGLFNRNALRTELAELAKDRKEFPRTMHLLSFDIDRFTEINEAHGSGAGDYCLTSIGHRIQKAAGPSSFIARMGGDEFAILLPDADPKSSIDDIACRVLGAVAEPIQWKEHTFQLTASMGSATRCAVDNFLPEDLVSEAHLALHDAKRSEKGSYRSFRPELQIASKERIETLRDVRRALAMRRLELYYQPKVRLADGRHQGFEALLRWNKSADCVVAPGMFLAALEDPILSKDIGDFVVASAIEQAEKWKREAIPFGHIAVNLSASQFRDRDFAENLVAALKDSGLDPSLIEVEVTENILLSNVSDNVLRVCKALKAQGVKIAFDDFGTGYASLSHLRDFPVDVIKIDRSFVSQLMSGESTTAIVKSIVGLAHSLAMEVTAEGVEMDSQASFLKAAGCDQGQGYLFGRPVPANLAVDHLRQQALVH